MTKLLKIIFIVSLAIINSFSISMAGDAALKRIMGFSPDGKYFTFEQYGIQDGSGFPYVDIFFIDTVKNTWLEDPVRIHIKDENVSIAKARALAIAKATPTIKRLNTILHGFDLVSNPITQFGTDKYNAHFGIHPSAPTYLQFKMQLRTQNANNVKCNEYAPESKMFSLSLKSETNYIPAQNYADTNLPNSRGCPLDYSISDVHYFEAVNGDTVFMTFVNVMTYGFEGPDRRFMVIPFYITK